MLLGIVGGCAFAESLQVLGASYRADKPFPQFQQFWSDSTQVEGARVASLGGSVHVYLRNTDQPLRIDDVLLEGISLKRAIAYSEKRKFKGTLFAASIYYSDLSQAERDKIISLGEPVWWKADPQPVPSGGAAEVVIRLRKTPQADNLKVVLQYAGGKVEASIPVKAEYPAIESIGFSPALDKVYLYSRHSKPNEPVKVLMDGIDITSACTIGLDPKMPVTPIVCQPTSPLARGYYHTFQVTYSDGSTAIAGIRAFADDFAYGVWGAKPGKETDLAAGKAHVMDMGVHNLNLQMEVIGSGAVRAYMYSDEGRQAMKALGIRQITGEPEKAILPALAYYLADEPDAADYKIQDVPPQAKIGCLGQGLIERAEGLRSIGPETPNMLNVDMTFKPDNWYTYGQLPDIFAADPYFQTRLAQAYWEKPGTLPMYSKATFVYAVGSICRSACAPKPLHLMLNSTRLQRDDRMFRFGTPEEKRIEVYYALAAGAKSLSYWWLVSIPSNADGSCGCTTDEPESKALWSEIGLLGAEVRTAGPVLEISCPADVPVKAPDKLWVRSLLSGTDTLVLLCVNDDYLCNKTGTIIKPVEKADVSVNLPSWLKPTDAFEINYKGTQDLQWDKSVSGMNLRLGTVDVARMIIITSDPNLRGQLQNLYQTKFADNVTKLLEQRNSERS